MSQTLEEEKKYVAFRLENEFYAIDVQRVNEVFVPTGSITPIPNAPSHVAGVINFRGSIVSVIDLKNRLSITSTRTQQDLDEDRVYVIIVRSGDSTIGLQVDYVESVISISKGNVQSTLDLISDAVKTAFLEGVARTDLGLTVLLSLDTILSEYDAKEVEKLAQIRERLSTEQETDEVVVTNEALVDLDKDDIDEYEAVASSGVEFKEVNPSGSDIGSSPLDLNSLSKAELLQIAMDLEIENVSTKSLKQELVDAINKKMGQ
ncbi:MAG: chemotaxis protein CheW [Candidatus Kariarchaeaceae archaeon]|jgi:purine-binding chemotaxis protein CheW